MRSLKYYERKYKKSGRSFIIGIDEAGRGPLAGPVVAGAVCLLKDSFYNRIDDSKLLSASRREAAFLEIASNSIFGIGIVNESVIDRVNILVATQLAMEQAVADLISRSQIEDPSQVQLLIDGPVRIHTEFASTCIIKGDRKDRSIAAASIVAKVTRDRIMAVYDKIFPCYGFCRHKGYPTASHRQAIKKFGASRIHRKSFCCV